MTGQFGAYFLQCVILFDIFLIRKQLHNDNLFFILTNTVRNIQQILQSLKGFYRQRLLNHIINPFLFFWSESI